MRRCGPRNDAHSEGIPRVRDRSAPDGSRLVCMDELNGVRVWDLTKLQVALDELDGPLPGLIKFDVEGG